MIEEIKFKKAKFFIIENPETEPNKAEYSGYAFSFYGKKWYVHRYANNRKIWVVTDPYTSCIAVYSFSRKAVVEKLIINVYAFQKAGHIDIMGDAICEFKKLGIKLPVNEVKYEGQI